jgi:hypothetical protein
MRISFSERQEIEADGALGGKKGQIRKNNGTGGCVLVLAGPAIMIGLCSLDLRCRG